MKHVLIVDDEPAICWGFRRLLSEEGCRVSVASSAEDGLRLAASSPPDAVVLDVRLPGMDGLAAISHFRERHGAVPIVVMTAFGNLDTAVRAIASGVVEYLPKPFDLDQAASLVRRLLGAVTGGAPARGVVGERDRTAPDRDALLGTSRAAQEVFKQIALAASGDVPVLITGESGVGKELVARAIHKHSRRQASRFVAISLAAMNSNVVESELFGHVRGAFTGAESNRVGVFEQAEGGTVLLDEIGDVPLDLQVKLLRTLERKEVQRVGETQTREADFRVIAATHRDIPTLIAGERFREDLYYRLGVYHIHIPPLRERREDIPALAQHFLSLASAVDRPRTFSAATMKELQSRPWRGNVRELRNAIEHASIVCREAEIGPEALPRPAVTQGPSLEDGLRSATRAWTQSHLQGRPVADDPLHDRLLQVVEKELIHESLAAHHGNRAATADRLGIHRATLRQKIKRLGIEAPGDDTGE